MSDRPERAIARVLRGDKAVGLAFASGSRRSLVTCAHVVNIALGRALRDPARPALDVYLVADFPFGGQRYDELPFRKARIAAWQPERGAFDLNDVAVLQTTEDLPASVKTLMLASGDLTGPIRLWGPSPDRPLGGFVNGEVLGLSDRSRLYVDQQLPGIFRARQGFSGGPAWRPTTGQVVGVLQAAGVDHDATDAYLLDAELVSAALRDSAPLPRITHSDKSRSTAATAVADPSRTMVLQTRGIVGTAAFSCDGAYIATACGRPGRANTPLNRTAEVWDARTGDLLAQLTHENLVTAVAFSPTDPDLLLTSSNDRKARVWSAARQISISVVTHGSWVRDIAFSQDGAYAVSGGRDGKAHVWRVATGEPITRITHGQWIRAVEFSPNGQQVLTGGMDGVARLWDTFTGRQLIAPLAHNGWVRAVAFDWDGGRVLTGSEDGTSVVWDTTTGAEISRRSHAGAVRSVAFGRDGSRALTGSMDQTARVWDTTTGAEISRCTHAGPVRSVAYSPNMKWVLSGSVDGTARLWSPDDGHEHKATRQKHLLKVYIVAFRSDSLKALSGSKDFTAKVWGIPAD